MDPLPGNRTSSQWMIGWKVANLVISDDGQRIAFLPVNSHYLVTPYGVDDVARCSVKPHHKVPHHDDQRGCHCGFNAFTERADAVRYMERPWSKVHCAQSMVLMRVALAGSVIEGHIRQQFWGYRAERQVVTDVFLPNRCSACRCTIGGVSEGYLVPFSRGAQIDFPGYRYLAPMCREHALNHSMSADEFARMSGAPTLRWADDVPTSGQLKTAPERARYAEYALSDDDVAFLKERAVATQTTYAEILREEVGGFAYVDAEPGYGSALLTIPDLLPSQVQPKRRQINLPTILAGW